MRTRVKLAVAVMAAVTLSTGGLATAANALRTAPAAGAAPPVRQPAGQAPPDARTASVTLLTGDHVLVDRAVDGHTFVTALPAPGRERIGFIQRGGDGQHITIVPADAVPLLNAGRLDPRLFDVTGLIAQGFDDQHSRDLRLIVTYADRPTAAAPRLFTAQRVHDLPAVNGVALRTPGGDAAATWAALTGATGPTGPTGAGGLTRAARLADGVRKVWLDGRAHVVDDESNAQIGVPAAWNAGFNGTGVTVGILDTGYDAAHPDLAGAVVEARDFTGGDGPVDRAGHGTHTATIIAGRGTASAGRFAGVAPGARLLVGKVCNDDGTCDESAIIDGMQWLAGRTKVVSMSLGGGATDGTDLVSQTVNKLSADTGTLFVCAAGNEGPGRETVGPPAVADAALAVASVNKQDMISDFSSAGPRLGDGAAKPDIAAPGEAIVAGRAAGTLEQFAVGPFYARLSGTSMATPHVSGAAAILLQQHPDWTGTQLKAALTSSAAPVAGAGPVFRSGAGRLDVATAISQRVFAGGPVSFGRVPWPRPADPVRRTVAYRNDGDTAVTLAQQLSLVDGDGRPAAGLLTVAPASVTVPAHGIAEATLTVDPKVLPRGGGSFSGRVAATADGVRTSTAVSLPVAPEEHDLKITALDANGRPAGANLDTTVILIDVDTGVGQQVPIENGTATVRLPVRHYRVLGWIGSPDPANPAVAAKFTLATQSVLVNRDRAVTLDGRRGIPLAVRVDRSDAEVKALTVEVTITAQNGAHDQLSVNTDPRKPIFAVPTGVGGEADFIFAVKAELGPATGPDAYRYHLILPNHGGIPARLTYRVHDSWLAGVTQRYHARGMPALATKVETGDYLGGFLFFGRGFPVSLPLTRREFFSRQPVRWTGYLTDQHLPGQPDPIGLNRDGMVRELMVTYESAAQPREWNSAVVGPESREPSQGEYVVRIGDRLTGVLDLDGPGEPGHGTFPGSSGIYWKGTVTLLRGDAAIGTVPVPFLVEFTAPPAKTRLAVQVTATPRHPRTWTNLNSRLDVRWEFDSASVAGQTVLPLLDLRMQGPFDVLDQAPAGATFPLEIAVGHQVNATTSATVTDVSLQVSFDDGATWRDTPVARHGCNWLAQIKNPPAGTGSGYASLRVRARDSDGGTIDQTVIRAYQLTH